MIIITNQKIRIYIFIRYAISIKVDGNAKATISLRMYYYKLLLN